jgi:hypothetical protein
MPRRLPFYDTAISAHEPVHLGGFQESAFASLGQADGFVLRAFAGGEQEIALSHVPLLI